MDSTRASTRTDGYTFAMMRKNTAPNSRVGLRSSHRMRAEGHLPLVCLLSNLESVRIPHTKFAIACSPFNHLDDGSTKVCLFACLLSHCFYIHTWPFAVVVLCFRLRAFCPFHLSTTFPPLPCLIYVHTLHLCQTDRQLAFRLSVCTVACGHTASTIFLAPVVHSWAGTQCTPPCISFVFAFISLPRCPRGTAPTSEGGAGCGVPGRRETRHETF